MVASCELPKFDIYTAGVLARDLFALEGPVKQLDGERDLNFLIGEPGERFVFKIANAEEKPAMLECQHAVFERLAAARVFPRVATARVSVHGRRIESVRDAAGIAHACRVLAYLEGRIFADLESASPSLLADIGHRLALLDRALDGFTHPALERPLLWRMERGPETVASYSPLLDPEQRRLVEYFASGISERLTKGASSLRRAVIHNDANRANLLVDEAGTRLLSVIDFGDMVNGLLVAEPAVAAAYVMLDHPAPFEAAADLVQGYHDTLPLQTPELELLPGLIGMRLCMSVCIAAYQCAQQPDNVYLSNDQDAAWRLLRRLRETGLDEFASALRPG